MQLYRIGVTGHRHLNQKTTDDFVRKACQDILIQAWKEHVNGIAAISSLAEGADTLFANLVLALHIPLEAIIAYQGFGEDFPLPADREHYRILLAQCCIVHQFRTSERSDEAYMTAGQWLVNNCDLLIAIWDGKSAVGKGGTGDVVMYAQQVGRKVAHIDITNSNVRYITPKITNISVNIDEYIAFVEDTSRISDRRQTVSSLYMTVNGALTGLLAFLVKDSGLANWWLVVAVVLITVFGVIICWSWRQLLHRYKLLVDFRFAMLREMETRIPNSVQMFHNEDDLYPRNIQDQVIKGKGLDFSNMEFRLPYLFATIYIVIGIALPLVTFLLANGIWL